MANAYSPNVIPVTVVDMGTGEVVPTKPIRVRWVENAPAPHRHSPMKHNPAILFFAGFTAVCVGISLLVSGAMEITNQMNNNVYSTTSTR